MRKRTTSFKSCPREGGNSLSDFIYEGYYWVSSHAPVKGATDGLMDNPQAPVFQVMPP